MEIEVGTRNADLTSSIPCTTRRRHTEAILGSSGANHFAFAFPLVGVSWLAAIHRAAIHNSLLSYNQADYGAGAAAFDQATINITNSNASHNRANKEGFITTAGGSNVSILHHWWAACDILVLVLS